LTLRVGELRIATTLAFDFDSYFDFDFDQVAGAGGVRLRRVAGCHDPGF